MPPDCISPKRTAAIRLPPERCSGVRGVGLDRPPRYTGTMSEEAPDGVSAEVAYYRAVEDLFGRLRGMPHTLSPKDFQLLRSWWSEGVPLAAVASGITEVFMKKKDRGDADPVVSLTYCRHAVKRHAHELAAMRTGAVPGTRLATPEIERQLRQLADGLAAAAARLVDEYPPVAEAIEACRRDLETMTPPGEAEAESLLLSLEASLLEACFDALDPGEREEIERVARELAPTDALDPAQRMRVLRAYRDRELRKRFSLPRLELA